MTETRLKSAATMLLFVASKLPVSGVFFQSKSGKRVSNLKENQNQNTLLNLEEIVWL